MITKERREEIIDIVDGALHTQFSIYSWSDMLSDLGFNKEEEKWANENLKYSLVVKSSQLNKKQLIESIEEEIKSLYADLWKYHKKELKSEGITKSNIEETEDCNLEGWEDIGWLVGRISGLDFIKQIIWRNEHGR